MSLKGLKGASPAALRRAFISRLGAVEHYLSQAQHLALPRLKDMAALRRDDGKAPGQSTEELRVGVITRNIEGALSLLRVVMREAP